MTDRDTFAAAALTGLLAGREGGNRVQQAYGIADAMLREREQTNHDAAPAARCEHGPRCRSWPAADGQATGDTHEPVAWAVVYPTGHAGVLCFFRRDAKERATASDRVVPLYRSPKLTAEEREAIERAVLGDDSFHAATLRSLLERLT